MIYSGDAKNTDKAPYFKAGNIYNSKKKQDKYYS